MFNIYFIHDAEHYWTTVLGPYGDYLIEDHNINAVDMVLALTDLNHVYTEDIDVVEHTYEGKPDRYDNYIRRVRRMLQRSM